MKRFNKLIIGLCTLGLLGTTLTTTTFAWFKINSQASVSGFDFGATGGRGFMLSVDGVHFSNDIKLKDMKKAMIVGYDSDYYTFDSVGNLVYNNGSGNIVSDTDIDKIIKENIQLSPVTSRYGYQMTDMSNVVYSDGASTGKWVEFDLYFKAASGNEDDRLQYDISLFVGSKNKKIEHTDAELSPTYLGSNSDQKKLEADMNMMFLDPDGNGLIDTPPQVVQYSRAENPIVYMQSVNALRFSTEERVYEYITDADSGEVKRTLVTDDDVRKEHSQIYEFFTIDDHGSYAVKNGTGIYSPTDSASFTYYNNVKVSKIDPIKEEDKPSTIRYQIGTDYAGEMPVITTVKPGPEIKKVTFRFWLEGWDADCFDGLAKSINVKLSFVSTEVFTDD